MHNVYQKYAKYYDLIYQKKNYEAESKFIIQKIKQYKPGTESLIDIGCGTSTHLLFLKDHIKKLVGVDLNQNILDVAKDKTNEIDFYQGDMKSFSINRTFDVLVSLYSVFNYNLTAKDAIETLNNFQKLLNNKGLIILALYKTNNTEKRIGIDTGEAEGIQVEKTNKYWLSEPNIESSKFKVKITEDGKEFTFEDAHKLRMFSLKEIKEMLNETNFELIEILDNFSEKSATEETRYQIVIARKK